MRKYIINEECYINTNNPTPVKNMLVAVNIVPLKHSKKFENFILGIDRFRHSCEEFGVGNDFPSEESFFVKSITLSENTDLMRNLAGIEEGCTDGLVARIETTKGIYYAWVYNQPKGFYFHTIYYTGNALKIDTIIEEC